MYTSLYLQSKQRFVIVNHRFIHRFWGQAVFECEKYVHNVFNKQLLDAYLQRVLLRIDACKVYYDVK